MFNCSYRIYFSKNHPVLNVIAVVWFVEVKVSFFTYIFTVTYMKFESIDCVGTTYFSCYKSKILTARSSTLCISSLSRSMKWKIIFQKNIYYFVRPKIFDASSNIDKYIGRKNFFLKKSSCFAQNWGIIRVYTRYSSRFFTF